MKATETKEARNNRKIILTHIAATQVSNVKKRGYFS